MTSLANFFSRQKVEFCIVIRTKNQKNKQKTKQNPTTKPKTQNPKPKNQKLKPNQTKKKNQNKKITNKHRKLYENISCLKRKDFFYPEMHSNCLRVLFLTIYGIILQLIRAYLHFTHISNNANSAFLSALLHLFFFFEYLMLKSFGHEQAFFMNLSLSNALMLMPYQSISTQG